MATIYTLGYTGCSPDALRKFVQHSSTFVIDTRLSPRSRNVAWNTEALVKLLGRGYYRHVKDLGNRNYQSDGPIAILNLARGLAEVQPVLASGMNVLLLCACPKPTECHRSIVADALAEASGCEVVHLLPRDLERKADGDAQIPMF